LWVVALAAPEALPPNVKRATGRADAARLRASPILGVECEGLTPFPAVLSIASPQQAPQPRADPLASRTHHMRIRKPLIALAAGTTGVMLVMPMPMKVNSIRPSHWNSLW
jgi:hypothetical protein